VNAPGGAVPCGGVEPTRLDAAVAAEEPPAAPPPGSMAARVGALRESETAKAAGLAAATMAQNLLALVATVVFTRLLGTGGYGSLAALLNLTVILTVPGSALQVAAARESTLGRLGRGGELAATLDRWTRHLGMLLVAVAIVGVLGRAQIAALLNVEEQWAAASVPVAAVLWLLLSVQRGLLQGLHAYRPVALSLVLDAVMRLGFGVALVLIGLDVTGAYLSTLLAFLGLAAGLHLVLRRRLGAPVRDTEQHPLRQLAWGGAVPIAALMLVAALQNVDVIMAKHALDGDTAGIYAACTVAAKALVWVAVGLGMWVLPEATRRAAGGGDARPVLLRAFAIIGAIAAPALIAYAAVPALVLRVAFGSAYEAGESVLLLLGIAYGLLATLYLAVQFLLGLHHVRFAAVLVVAAALLPVVLLGADDLTDFAWRVLAIHAAAALAIVAAALVRRPAPAT
jgi:O-antigen/teichoic acid export membrane protein